MRKLASIQTIAAVTKHPNADALDLVQVLGWQCVAKRDEFRVGDLVVYMEIDSILPMRPEFAFLSARGMRIKTIRLRGELSQGIVFPLSILPVEAGQPVVDMDVTDVLGVVKYEPKLAASLAGTARGNFPSFIPKTDETRVQNLKTLLEKYAGTECYITEKLDGSSCTFYIKDCHFGVCSRNLELMHPLEGNAMSDFAIKNNLEERMGELGFNVAIQGEIIGPGIQGNKYRLNGFDFRVFSVYLIDSGRYADRSELVGITEFLCLKTVPILDDKHKMMSSIADYIQMADDKSVLNDQQWREGIVIRPTVPIYDSRHGFVSFKAISNQFLLKCED